MSLATPTTSIGYNPENPDFFSDIETVSREKEDIVIIGLEPALISRSEVVIELRV